MHNPKEGETRKAIKYIYIDKRFKKQKKTQYFLPVIATEHDTELAAICLSFDFVEKNFIGSTDKIWVFGTFLFLM